MWAVTLTPSHEHIWIYTNLPSYEIMFECSEDIQIEQLLISFL